MYQLLHCEIGVCTVGNWDGDITVELSRLDATARVEIWNS